MEPFETARRLAAVFPFYTTTRSSQPVSVIMVDASFSSQEQEELILAGRVPPVPLIEGWLPGGNAELDGGGGDDPSTTIVPMDARALSQMERQVLARVRTHYEEVLLGGDDDGPAFDNLPEEMVCRVLRTMMKRHSDKPRDVPIQTAEMLMATLKWRKSIDADSLITRTLEHTAEYHGGWPTRVLYATDKHGRMLVYDSIASIDSEYLRMISPEEVELLHAQLLECISIERRRRCAMSPARMRVYSHLHILDLEGFSLVDAMKEHVLRTCKTIFGLSKRHFTGCVYKIYIVNCPLAFYVMWNVLAPWLPHDTIAKIRFIRGSGIDELGRDEGVDRSSLPAWMGATPRGMPMVGGDERNGLLVSDLVASERQRRHHAQ